MRIKKPITQKQFVINTLRRASWRWGPRNKAKNAAKIGRNQYVCFECKTINPNKNTKIDHKEPVVALTGFVDWNTYIERLYCDESGFQILCRDCHAAKTLIENTTRREIKKANKK